MAGAGSRRDEVPSINSNNVFAALGSLKKKKKKEQGSSKSKGSNGKEPEKEVFWAPAPLTVKSWADVDEDDDDDYYATTAPPETVWGASAADANSETVKESEAAAEESESEDEGLDDAEDDAEEEHENEPESPVEADSVKLPPEPSSTTKENERQLSKKELKKKELEELEAVLAELGYTQREPSGQDDSHATKNAGLEKKEGEGNGEMERKDNASGESKSARKKKKKDKSLKEQKGSQDHPDGVEVENTTSETGDAEKAEDVSAVDVKERLKKVASMKKKKSSKEMDAAARAAASEAAARNAKLAASKKKEKAHYNQQPVR